MGEVTVWDLMPGVQALCNDLHLMRCAAPSIPRSDVIEIVYCITGRYECHVSDRNSFYVSAGDLSVGTAGRIESYGGFPTRRFVGITFLMDPRVLCDDRQELLNELGIDMDAIIGLAERKPHYFILRNDEQIRAALEPLTGIGREKLGAMLRVKFMELLVMLSDGKIAEKSSSPVYISRKQAKAAMIVYTRVLRDLSEHVSIETLSQDTGLRATALKAAFRNVYGESIYAFQKNARLQEAARLLHETELSVTEIAECIGYTNPSKFSAAFRKQFGTVPTKYRKSIRVGMEES